MMRVLLEIIVGLTTGILFPMAKFGGVLAALSALSGGGLWWWRRGRQRHKDQTQD